MQEANIITQLCLPIALAVMMFSVGLELSLSDFRRVFSLPKAFTLGLISQVFILPAVAFGILSVWSVRPELAFGLMLIAACPGGVTSNLLTYFAQGDTALSISLTTVTSVMSVFSLPLILSFSMSYFMGHLAFTELSIWRTILSVFMITTIPVAIGMVANRSMPEFTIKYKSQSRVIASILFVLVITWAIISERTNIIVYFEQVGLLVLILNIVMMVLAFTLCKICNLKLDQNVAITFECGLQNGTLAVFIAATLIGNNTMMVPGAIYSLIMFLSAAIFLIIVKFFGCRDC